MISSLCFQLSNDGVIPGILRSVTKVILCISAQAQTKPRPTTQQPNVWCDPHETCKNPDSRLWAFCLSVYWRTAILPCYFLHVLLSYGEIAPPPKSTVLHHIVPLHLPKLKPAIYSSEHCMHSKLCKQGAPSTSTSSSWPCMGDQEMCLSF